MVKRKWNVFLACILLKVLIGYQNVLNFHSNPHVLVKCKTFCSSNELQYIFLHFIAYGKTLLGHCIVNISILYLSYIRIPNNDIVHLLQRLIPIVEKIHKYFLRTLLFFSRSSVLCHFITTNNEKTYKLRL